MPSAAAPTTRDVRVSAAIKASPKRVYRALTSARELCLWWLERAETDARSLGRVRMVWPEALGWGEAEGVFVDLEPESKVAWLWGGRGVPRGVPRLVNVFIEPRPGGCGVTVVQAGFPADADGRRAAFRARWEDCLAKLALYLEKGRARKAEILRL
ncbi:MAG TPA: SRPBCC domain-containing protein [Elusimicrobiota bacterium]|nr:SRPBCC domain-containing protein [Elusimicrobiota bacterium]